MEQRIFHYKFTHVPWWIVLIQGGIVSLVGLLLIFLPRHSIVVLFQLLGLYWFVSGILSLTSLVVHRSAGHWKLIGSLLGIIAGVIVFLYPHWRSFVQSPLTVFLLLGAVGVVYGVIQIIQGFREADLGPLALGLVSGILGIILLLASPILAVVVPAIAFSVIIVLGICCFIGGILLIALASRLRHRKHMAATMRSPQI